MSRFTRFRDRVTGTVGGLANTALGAVGGVSGLITGGLGGLTGLGGLSGLLGGGMAPLPQQGSMMQSVEGTSGYQNNLENLLQQMGQQVGQAQIAPTSSNEGGGLI